jgi:translation initiation factor IF-1
LQTFDAQRLRVAGTKDIIQSLPGGMTDDVQMHAGDRIVVTLVMADGKKYKVYDKTMDDTNIKLFIFKISLWLCGACTLPIHMRQGSGMTPPGYR